MPHKTKSNTMHSSDKTPKEIRRAYVAPRITSIPVRSACVLCASTDFEVGYDGSGGEDPSTGRSKGGSSDFTTAWDDGLQEASTFLSASTSKDAADFLPYDPEW